MNSSLFTLRSSLNEDALHSSLNKNRLTILGTGNAVVTRCYNTCFILHSEHSSLMVDAGGGNGILSQLEKAHESLADISHLFVTHAHTDHILGVVWVLRMVASGKGCSGTFHVWGNDKVMRVLHTITDLTFSRKHLSALAERVAFHELKDGDSFMAGDISVTCFDIHSTKEKQFGFRATMPDGLVVACLGDEPYNEANRALVEHADWLLSEAFCLYADRDRFRPYEKHHSTALDAGRLAAELGVKHLLLYHTEDKTLATRRTAYAAEAAREFGGEVCVPDDLDIVELTR